MSKVLVEELGHVHVPLSFVELHYEQEAARDIPWTAEKFEIAPYIFYLPKGDQVYFYYDPRGVAWQMEHAGKCNDVAFALDQLKKHYDSVHAILKEESALDQKGLVEFLSNIRNLWPWLNYMWWGIEYKEKNKEPLDDLLAMRKYTEYFTPGLAAVLRNTIKNLHPSLAQYADVLLLSEIEQERIPEISILERRLENWAYTNYRLYNSWEELLTQHAVAILEYQTAEELKGQVAYKGKVRGEVKIISKTDDMKDFREGQILVASTTTPNFMPAITIAGALISEHGGVICHAAITSRELKIPCIVGVKGATKALKDGDLVEVDADAGIIRKINA